MPGGPKHSINKFGGSQNGDDLFFGQHQWAHTIDEDSLRGKCRFHFPHAALPRFKFGDEPVVEPHLGDEERLALIVVLSEKDKPARVRNSLSLRDGGSAEEKASSFEDLTRLGDGDGVKSGWLLRRSTSCGSSGTLAASRCKSSTRFFLARFCSRSASGGRKNERMSESFMRPMWHRKTHGLLPVGSNFYWARPRGQFQRGVTCVSFGLIPNLRRIFFFTSASILFGKSLLGHNLQGALSRVSPKRAFSNAR